MSLDALFKTNLHFSTFAKTTLDFTNQVAFINLNLFADEVFNICLFIK